MRALFLDRDGVINVNHGHVGTRERFDFIDGIFEICRLACQRGYLLIVVTNQAGIGRGYYTEADFQRLNDWMLQEFERQGAGITKVYHCPYHPEHGIGHYKRESPMRKPAPGMILAAAEEFGIDLARSVLVGDSQTDIDAGRAAGVASNIRFAPNLPNSQDQEVIDQLMQLKRWLV